ncbi:hypothetical protein NCU17208 [Neurospora crassa OR74A]|uniref:Uncharacterized protein n=1 Tax=Neurospora crassa (strain ATCC 24698 / 74-OR23-1A / CBS 708.71 / DSM 1257 / FGSC 987) TaxID=367110 RepID=V5IME3_NEUCR|nr:hypothetical protein NCU17208 [Neurospora crassa OR74A]ESA41901.1 hypothetical protein NCU17208 [Neurospora crassa OR74A]|eukprot:XP_011395363.1 hypothetical protein NCU17208 [Neurospora crassa OR74A]
MCTSYAIYLVQRSTNRHGPCSPGRISVIIKSCPSDGLSPPSFLPFQLFYRGFHLFFSSGLSMPRRAVAPLHVVPEPMTSDSYQGSGGDGCCRGIRIDEIQKCLLSTMADASRPQTPQAGQGQRRCMSNG